MKSILLFWNHVELAIVGESVVYSLGLSNNVHVTYHARNYRSIALEER